MTLEGLAPTTPQLATVQGGDLARPGDGLGVREAHAAGSAESEKRSQQAQGRTGTKGPQGNGPGWRRATSTSERTVPAHTAVNQEQDTQDTRRGQPTGGCQYTGGAERLSPACEWIRGICTVVRDTSM